MNVTSCRCWLAVRLAIAYTLGANALPAMPTLSTATDRAAAIARAISHAALREPQQLTVTARGELIAFESRLSDAAAQDLLQHCTGSFARSLWQQSHNRQLSPAQLAWAHKLACDLLESESPADSDDKEPQFSGLFEPFMAARAKGAKRLTMRFSDAILKLNKGGDAIWVLSATEKVEGDYGLQPKYLGKVTPNRLDSRIPDSVKAVLLEAASDPLTAAIRYGRETGSCSCCGKELTNAESIRLGIGPICREKFGL